MELKVLKINGTESGDVVNLPDEIFGIEPNTHLIYQAVRTYLSNRRQGTHKSKERSEVRGGGRKAVVQSSDQDLTGIIWIFLKKRQDWPEKVP